MPQLKQHQSNDFTKMLYIGDSGTGKTGSLVSLVKAGYKLAILDFDNGLDILFNLVQDQCPDKMDNVFYETVTDEFQTIGTDVKPKNARAFAQAMKLLTHWKTDEYDMGKPSEWGPDYILVIDSLTLMSKAAMHQALFLNGRIASKPQIQDWGQAMDSTENVLAMLYSEQFKCNVIVCSHISYIEGDDGVSRGYTSALGNKLPPKIGRYFNTILMAKVQGSGPSAKRTIHTAPVGMIPLKNPKPAKLPDSLPLDSGLAMFFETVRS